MTISLLALVLTADCYHPKTLKELESLAPNDELSLNLLMHVVSGKSAEECPDGKAKAEAELAALKKLLETQKPEKLGENDAKAKEFVTKEAKPYLGDWNEKYEALLSVDRVVLKEKKWKKVVNQFGVPLEKSRRIEVVYRIKDQPFCWVSKAVQVESYAEEDRDQPFSTELRALQYGHDMSGRLVACK